MSVAGCARWSVGRSVGWLVTHSFNDPHVVPYWPTGPCFNFVNVLHKPHRFMRCTRGISVPSEVDGGAGLMLDLLLCLQRHKVAHRRMRGGGKYRRTIRACRNIDVVR